MNDKYLTAYVKLASTILAQEISDIEKGNTLVAALHMLEAEYERDLRDQYNGKGE